MQYISSLEHYEPLFIPVPALWRRAGAAFQKEGRKTENRGASEILRRELLTLECVLIFMWLHRGQASEPAESGPGRTGIPLILVVWERLPVIVRAVVLGELVVTIGGLPELLLFVNLKALPAIPWSLPVCAVSLWFLWRYLNGAGWPRSTAQQRKRDLRGTSLPGRLWLPALLAGALGMTSVVMLAFLTPRFGGIPRDAFKLPIDLSLYRWWTVVSVLLGISLFAGIVEEAGFRGIMLSQIQRRHGWPAAILITGFVFFLDHHFSHAYATFAFLPFFLAVSILHGLLVYFTRSILPSILLHSVADFIVIPIQYGFVGNLPTTSVFSTGIDRPFLICFAVLFVSAIAAVPAFIHLSRTAKLEVASEAAPPA